MLLKLKVLPQVTMLAEPSLLEPLQVLIMVLTMTKAFRKNGPTNWPMLMRFLNVVTLWVQSRTKYSNFNVFHRESTCN
jgi:hypothetical protein